MWGSPKQFEISPFFDPLQPTSTTVHLEQIWNYIENKVYKLTNETVRCHKLYNLENSNRYKSIVL